MMELADVTDSKSVVGDNVWVRVPLPAPDKKAHALTWAFLIFIGLGEEALNMFDMV